MKRGGNETADTTLYLFDGFNLLHAGGFGSPEELRDLLASWVAAQGARGVLVFDGEGATERHGQLEVRWAKDADTLLERLAAEHRQSEQVAVVSSDAAVRGTTGIEVRKIASQTFLGELEPPSGPATVRGDLRDRLDAETLARLERLRRGER
jgi:predicted RNA-binding protein with PIN domain